MAFRAYEYLLSNLYVTYAFIHINSDVRVLINVDGLNNP